MDKLTKKQEEIFAVADRLFAETNEKPSVRAIRSEIGGSNSTINDAMKIWRAQNDNVQVEPLNVPESVLEALSKCAEPIWKLASELAERGFNAFKTESEQKVLEAELERDQTFIDLDTAETEITQLKAQLDASQKELRSTKAALTKSLKAEKSASDELIKTSGKLEQLQSDHNALLNQMKEVKK